MGNFLAKNWILIKAPVIHKESDEMKTLILEGKKQNRMKKMNEKRYVNEKYY